MTPANIVGMAVVKQLDVIALTDHNTCKNCPAFLKVAKEYGITAIAGMELTTREEVHVVCLFEQLEDAMRFDTYVYERLLNVKNEEKIFGTQFIRNEEDVVIGKVEKLLINATDISFDEVYDLMEQYDGVMIPAHIDKSSTSLLSNLGFIPPDSRFKTVELKNLKKLHSLQEKQEQNIYTRIQYIFRLRQNVNFQKAADFQLTFLLYIFLHCRYKFHNH